jgi:tRNA(fMet)-specific endonuclease VapC
VTLRYLLDTSIVSSPISKTPNRGILRRLTQHAGESAIAAPVWHELTFGLRRLPRGRRRTALGVYLQDVVRASFPILPYDDAAATWHGEERARLEALGRPVPYVDAQIAAVAHAHQLVLVTVNSKDFTPFANLRIEDWASP